LYATCRKSNLRAGKVGLVVQVGGVTSEQSGKTDMNPRLDALLRQQALLREHARWLDDEIAAERMRLGSAVPAGSTPNREETVVASPRPIPAELPEPDIKGLHSEVRYGCLFYFTIAAGVLGALIAFIYWKY